MADNRTQLAAIMNANLPTNGTGSIDAVEHRTVVQAIIDSAVNLVEDASKLGLKELDATRSYVANEGFLFEGSLWQSVSGHAPGENPNSPGTATFNRISQIPTIERFVEWDSATTYDTGDTVKRNFKLYESLVDNNLDNDPALEDPLVNWVEVSASENTFGETYVVDTIYSKRQVVYHETLEGFYWLDIATETFKSVNFATELANGTWQTLGEDSIKNDITQNLGESLGGIEDQEVIAAGTTLTGFVTKLLTTVFVPTFISPSFSLSDSGANLVEIDTSLTFDLTFNFNRGKILGDLVSGVWNPSTEQDKRAGVADSYTIDGVTQAGNVLSVTKSIVQGINTYSATVTYLVGPQPLDSSGANFSTPFPAGTSASQSATKEGVYPIFATTVSITVSTKQALVSMINGNNIDKTLVAESGGNKQYFDIPNAWLSGRPVTKIEFFNPVSGSFDSANQLSTFSQTATTHTVQGNVINYTRFTNNGPDRGSQRIKIIF